MSSMSLQGSLEVFKIPDVLTFLHSVRKTGMLTLTLAEKEAYIFFRAGSVVYAASKQESLRLGPILARKQKLSHDQAAEIDDLIMRSDGRFVHVVMLEDVGVHNRLDIVIK